MADYEDTKVSNLIINNISQEKYDELAAAGELDPTQVYLTPTEASGGANALTKPYRLGYAVSGSGFYLQLTPLANSNVAIDLMKADGTKAFTAWEINTDGSAKLDGKNRSGILYAALEDCTYRNYGSSLTCSVPVWTYVSGQKSYLSFQTTKMPAASSSLTGVAATYIGDTDETFTKGHTYMVESDGAETPTYTWKDVYEVSGGDFATKDYVDEQVLDTFSYLSDADTTIRSNINQLDKNIRTVADWVNVKDEDGNRAVLETEAQDAYRAINELNTKVNGCLPLSGGTLTGELEFEWSGNYLATKKTILKSKYHRLDTDEIVSHDVAELETTGAVRFFTTIFAGGVWPNSIDGSHYLGNDFYHYGNTFTRKLNAGRQNGVNSGDLIVPTEGGTLARLEDLEGIGGGASLPDQTGNAGKFLTTDGTTLSWGAALVNVATGTSSLAIGHLGKSTASYSIALGPYTEDSFHGVAIGYNARTIGGNFATAIGSNAEALAARAIQLGAGTNKDANTFKVYNGNGNFELMDANGNVPRERLKNLVEVLPTADNGYTTVKNFGNNYIEATGIYEVGSVEANAEVVEVIAFPEGVQFEEGQMYWANAHATTEDTNGNTVVANVISRSGSDMTIVYKNLGSTAVENLTICWEVRGMLATA